MKINNNINRKTLYTNNIFNERPILILYNKTVFIFLILKIIGTVE